MREKRVVRCGFKSRKQSALFMIWEERWYNGDVTHAQVLFSTRNFIGDSKHWLRKFGRTVKFLGYLFCARMFGKYEYSGWDGEIEYARYRWRGKQWIIPTSHVKTDEEM